MTYVMHWILVYFFLFSTQAAPLSEALTQYADRPALYGVLTDFLALSKIFRLSGHEAGVREWIAEQAKKNDRSFQTDAAGNITVHVPGTGRFLKTKNAIALQGHMDMVPGVKNLKPGETVEDYFKRPLDLVVDSGWIFSRDHLTTVGADDGIGLALMLRYLKPTQVEHPPLELIFTADEENEMTGAQGLTLSPALRALINLDLDEFGHAATGCQGDGNATATFSALNETPPLLRARGVRIHLHGLLGGHSGGNIHLGLANAVQISSELFTAMIKQNIDVYLRNGSAGDVSPTPIYNKIPNAAQWILTVTETDEPRLIALVTAQQKKLKKMFPNEAIALEITQLVNDPEPAGVPLKKIAALFKTVNTFPNGVVMRNKKYPHPMEVSSNLSFLGAEKITGGLRFSLGIMSRGFTDSGLKKFLANAQARLETLPFADKKVVMGRRFPAWTPRPQAKLASLVSARFKADFPKEKPLKAGASPGGLETALLYQKNPGLEMISIGPNIRDEHSTEESLEIASVENMIPFLDHVLEDIGNSEIIRDREKD